MSSTTQSNSPQEYSVTEDTPSTDVEKLLHRYQLTVFTLAMHLLNDKRLAQNVVEEVFLKLSKRDSLPKEESEVTAQIHSITYDIALRELVSQRRAKKAH